MIIKLRRFKKYLTEIQRLKARVNELEAHIEQFYYHQEGAIRRTEKIVRDSEDERIERERQAESDRWYREDQLRRATSDLERAVSYGDEYGIKRATEKLKRLD